MMQSTPSSCSLPSIFISRVSRITMTVDRRAASILCALLDTSDMHMNTAWLSVGMASREHWFLVSMGDNC